MSDSVITVSYNYNWVLFNNAAEGKGRKERFYDICELGDEGGLLTRKQ